MTGTTPGRREFLRRWWSFRPAGRGVLILAAAMVGCRLLGLPLAAAIFLPIAAAAVLAAVFASAELSNERAAQVDEQAGQARRVDLAPDADQS
ncbi:hypothetical protein JOL79_11125 [Microbispora sp. RL4-1S]|uniref:Uncharacterized protein n=1 Tax=Microbispora oryzae TaxID=2806554 RepID=A0A940WP85_9ACTN|nr:hypothetical protein [Microbispora oryzae]MBP2704364.1 hypothetical protein [Microbispora oryzae]